MRKAGRGATLRARRTRPSLPRSVGASLRARNLEYPPILQADRRQAPAPQATRIQSQEVFLGQQTERRPVTADEGRVGALAVRRRKPRNVTFRNILEPALVTEFHAAVGGAYSQSGHHVDDHAQTIISAQRIIPAVRLIA